MINANDVLELAELEPSPPLILTGLWAA